MGTYNVNNGVITPVDELPEVIAGREAHIGNGTVTTDVTPTNVPVVPKTVVPATKKPTTLQGYIDELSTYMPSISQEEIERRKRKAYMTEGIGHLGNALAALGNVYYTGKGAPSQAPGKVQRMAEEADKLDQTEYAKRLNAYKLAQANMQQDYANEIAKQKNVLEQVRLANQEKRDAETLAARQERNDIERAKFNAQLPGIQADNDRKRTVADNTQRTFDDKHAVSVAQQARDYAAAQRSRLGNRQPKYAKTSYGFEIDWDLVDVNSWYNDQLEDKDRTPAPSIINGKESAADKEKRIRQDVAKYINNHPEARAALGDAVRSISKPRASSQQTRTQSQGSSLGVSGSGNRGNQRSSSRLGVSGSK